MNTHTDIIASKQLVAVDKTTAERITIHINIYSPKVLPNIGNLTQAECAREIVGLYPKILPVIALTTFDALSDACDSIKVLLEHKRKTFDFYYPDSGEDYFDLSAPHIAV